MSSLVLPSPLGSLTLTSNGHTITRIDFGKRGKKTGSDAVLSTCAKELQEYFAGTRSTFSVRIKAEGTDFQKKIWKEMSRIPCGETISYKELAKRVGKPKAIRAAASACGKNPIVILIPCHRIVTSSGGIGGYSGGLEKKKWLLKRESNEQRH